MSGVWASWPRRALILPLEGLILAYRITLSPVMGRQCRYVPTCSVYGMEALREHGPVRGAWMTVRRVMRCHPFARGGYDPVPPGKSVGSEGESKRNTEKEIGAAGKCSLDSVGPTGLSGGTGAEGGLASGGAADEPTSCRETT